MYGGRFGGMPKIDGRRRVRRSWEAPLAGGYMGMMLAPLNEAARRNLVRIVGPACAAVMRRDPRCIRVRLIDPTHRKVEMTAPRSTVLSALATAQRRGC